MKLHVATAGTPAQAVLQLAAQTGGAADAQLLFTFYGCQADDVGLHQALGRHFPGVPVLGGTSSGGLLSNRGAQDDGAGQIGLLCITDAQGDYGVAAAPLGDDASSTAQQVLAQALANCGCAGELPELVWIYQCPGREEQVLAGLRRVVGDRCPIIGGSSADDDVSGQWRQFGPAGPLRDGLVVAVLFPSRPIGFAFQGGYEPMGPSGVVTGIGFQPDGPSGVVTASSGREILTIDGAPAADVYNRWAGGRIAGQLAQGGSILAETTMLPLATSVGQTDGVPHFLLVHPEAVTAGGALRTFCDLQVGDRVYAMRGDRQRLIDRAGRVVAQAQRALPAGSSALGALLVYCGGCKMAVGEQIAQVAGAVAHSLAGAPFIGCYTFGEQGRLLDRNLHGNLMISAVVFGS